MNPGFPAWQAGVLVQARRPPLLVFPLVEKLAIFIFALMIQLDIYT